ncbi:MAG: LLM class flavin-dependent oxidoreductase [Acidimicrobiia bacterium]|nr:LLM class flavin-dependent oxidoreductase [Acidimicrobiia bacterium]
MRVSLWIQNTLPWSEIVELATLADGDEAWDTVWFADHYMPNSEAGEVVDGDVHEAWAVLAALAVVTRRVRLGPLVSPTSIHHPALLANRAATIDHLSNGRFVLGLGAGWQVNEHRAYGIELEPPKERVDRFAEAIEIIRSLLDNNRTDYDGQYYRFTDAPCNPHPVQDSLPLLVGTSGRRMMMLTARWADEWNTWGAPSLAGTNRRRFVRACEDVGTDPASMRTSAQSLVFFNDDPEVLAKRTAKVDMERAVSGNAEQLVEELNAYADIGFDEFIVLTGTFGRDAAERRETIERFAAEVTANLG